MCNNCAVYHRGWGKKLIHRLIGDNSTWIVEYMRMLMCIPDATSKWGLRESEWIDCNRRVCVHDEPQSKHVPNWGGNGYAVNACIFACLFACLLSHASVPIWREEVRTCICDPIRGFPFRLEISHTHAEIDIGHLPGSIFRPRSSKRRRLKVTEGYRRYRPQGRALMTNIWTRHVHFALSFDRFGIVEMQCNATVKPLGWNLAERGRRKIEARELSATCPELE